MRYRPGLPLVLEDVSFRVKSGDKLGVVGRTGSGKSSLIQVLFRLTDCCAGRVLIGGVSTADIGVGALRSIPSFETPEPPGRMCTRWTQRSGSWVPPRLLCQTFSTTMSR